jgi:hypothetical protein
MEAATEAAHVADVEITAIEADEGVKVEVEVEAEEDDEGEGGHSATVVFLLLSLLFPLSLILSKALCAIPITPP